MRTASFYFAGLAAAIIIIAPAKAEEGKKKPVLVTERAAEIGARWKNASTYTDCMSVATEIGWTAVEGWYGCNPRKFKK